MLMKKSEFVNELRKVIPELPANICKLDISVCVDQPILVRCEFYVSEKLQTTTLEIEDENQPDSSN